jgi:thymidylate kinase
MIMDKLIVFEGIDNSGKTTLSKKILEILNNDLKGALDRLRQAPDNTGMIEFLSSWESRPWVWSKEPDFSTEEADRLNSKDSKLSEAQREVLFLESRLRKQHLYNSTNILLDRYLWTGVAYAKVFSPSTYEFVKVLYASPIFKKPDLMIFVDTDVKICHEREPEVSLERLNLIRDAYMATKDIVGCPVVIIDGNGDVETNVGRALKPIEDLFNGIRERNPLNL